VSKARPKLLDLFCGAGGCACGYTRAGFDVTGVDHVPQKRYLLSGATRFVQTDALEYLAEHGREYDVIHASPPCQAYSRATAWVGDRSSHPDLIAAVQRLLAASGRSYVLENVQDARHLLHEPVMLCGTMFGLPFQRHRYFECPWLPFELQPDCQHRSGDYSHDHGAKQTESVYREALGCDWMTCHEARQAIPPAYCEWLGRRLITIFENP